MKTLKLFGMTLIVVLMCVNFASCSNDKYEIPQKGKEVIVSLGFGGEFEVSETPLSRATNNDLYLIDVRHYSSGLKKYAYGLFDDVSSIKVKLTEGEKYCFFAYIIKDGKTKLKHDENAYKNSPFKNSTLNNSFVYSDSESILDDVTFEEWTLIDGNTYKIPNLVLYTNNSTCTERYTATENGSTTITMERSAFGARFEVINLVKGTLNISIADETYGNSPQITLDTSNLNNEDIYYFPTSIVDEEINLTVSIIWNKDGEEKELGIPVITFKKGVMTTVKIKVDNTSGNGINFTIDDSEIQDDKTYIVDGNTVTEEPTE